MVLKSKIIASQQKDVYKFVEDIKVGTYGEYTLKKYFNRYYPQLLLEDKSAVSRYQSADVDLLLENKNGDIISLEIKNDRTLYKNLFYETVSVRKDGKDDTPGCLIVTEADYLVYIYQAIKVAVFVPVEKLNKWVVSYLSDTNNRPFDKVSVINDGYKAEGYKIPVKSLLGETKGIDAAQGIKLIDIQENKNLTYQEYEAKRYQMYLDLDRAWYSSIEDISNWEEDNEMLYPNKNNLNVDLLQNDVRLVLSKKRLRYLNALYSRRKILIKATH